MTLWIGLYMCRTIPGDLLALMAVLIPLLDSCLYYASRHIFFNLKPKDNVDITPSGFATTVHSLVTFIPRIQSKLLSSQPYQGLSWSSPSWSPLPSVRHIYHVPHKTPSAHCSGSCCSSSPISPVSGLSQCSLCHSTIVSKSVPSFLARFISVTCFKTIIQNIDGQSFLICLLWSPRKGDLIQFTLPFPTP